MNTRPNTQYVLLTILTTRLTLTLLLLFPYLLLPTLLLPQRPIRMSQIPLRSNDIPHEWLERFDFWGKEEWLEETLKSTAGYISCPMRYITHAYKSKPKRWLNKKERRKKKKHTRETPIPLPIPQDTFLRRDLPVMHRTMPYRHCEHATGFRDEGDFPEVCAECWEEFLGELLMIFC